MKTHDLKIQTQYFEAVKSGVKNFELRRNDRNFEVGDIINLYEVSDFELTGRILESFKIKFILNGGIYGLEKGYVIMSIEPCGKELVK